jgi:hypothetical protein
VALNLDMGVFGGTQAAWPGTAGTNAAASPQGPATAAEAGFGVSAGGGGAGMDAKTTGVLSVGTLSLVLLAYLWWSLPR